MKRYYLFFSLAALCLMAPACFAGSYGMVLPKDPSRTVQHAGRELGKYLQRMTGAPVLTGVSAVGADTVFLLDSAGSNSTVKALVDGGSLKEPDGWTTGKSADAYYLWSVRNYVVLAGKSDPAVLYAVYEYLERYGGCGFFEDGDYVPQKAPRVTGIDYFTSPRFSFRHMRGDLCGVWGIKKFHYFHWKEDDWTRFYDWMAKRRLNVSDCWPLADSLKAGKAVEMTFGIRDDEPMELYGSGWPLTWSWPAKERTHILQYRLAYHRMLGIKSMYLFYFGQTPPPFKKMHPEYKWVPSDYEHAMLHPSDPASY